ANDMTTPVGGPLSLLGEAISGGREPELSRRAIQPLVNEAVRRWRASQENSEAGRRLDRVRVEVMDLPGTRLGLASSQVIRLDSNAAGHGWFVDPSTWDDSEFVRGMALGRAANRVDLLTVVTHELGHVLGLDDDHKAEAYTGGVMAEALPVGVRRINLV